MLPILKRASVAGEKARGALTTKLRAACYHGRKPGKPGQEHGTQGHLQDIEDGRTLVQIRTHANISN